MNPSPETDKTQQPPVLPYLCDATTILGLVIVGELVALVLSLASTPGHIGLSWESFGMLSMITQWIILCCAACLCQLQPLLNRIPSLVAGSLAYITCLLVAALSLWLANRYLIVQGSQSWIKAFVISATVIGILLRYLWLQQQLRNREQAELTARFEALQARIQPHFLFNSMNSIASLIAIDPKAAEKAVEDLSALFRASLHQDNLVLLQQEVDLCRRYIAIEALRLGDRLRISWQLPETLPELKIPALLLQPLLENSIVHGIQRLKSGGDVIFTISISDQWVNIHISNPYTEEVSNTPSENNNRIALKNIQHRLDNHFSGRAILSTEKNPKTGQFQIHLRLPAQNKQ